MASKVLITQKKYKPMSRNGEWTARVFYNQIEDMCAVITTRGHALTKHATMDEVATLNDLLDRSDDKKAPDFEAPTATAFLDAETAASDIVEGMYPRIREVAEWRLNEGPVPSGERLTLKTEIVRSQEDIDEFDEDYHPLRGPAFIQTPDDICRTHSTDIGLILEPYPTSRMLPDDYNFGLVTAFPKVNLDIAPRIDDDLTDLIKQTRKYREATPFLKAVWEYKAALKPADRLRARLENGKSVFSVDCARPGQRDRSKLRVHQDGSMSLQSFPRDKETGRPMPVTTVVTDQNRKQLSQRYPEAFRIAGGIADRIGELDGKSRPGMSQGQAAPKRPTADEVRKARLQELDRATEGLQSPAGKQAAEGRDWPDGG